MNRYARIIFKFCIIIFCGIPMSGAGDEIKGHLIEGNNLNIRIPLNSYGNFSRSEKDVHIQFSQNGKYLCLWWSNEAQNTQFPSQWIVFTENGKMISSWKDSVVEVNKDLSDFPALLAAIKWQKEFDNIVTYCIDQDGVYCVRAFPQSIYIPPKPPISKIEMVRLCPDTRIIWKQEIQNFHNIEILGFLPNAIENKVIVGFEGTSAYILNAATGSIVSEFTYGKIETDAEAVKRKKKFHLKYSDDDPALRFSSGVLAFDAEKKLIAAGGFHDRRIRVILLVSPYPVVFEANTNENPQLPRGGSWRVYWIDFAASGKYLIAEYFFAGRGTDVVLRITEIFETGTWRKIWEAEDRHLYSVSISSDGKKIAYIRNNVLEIRPFVSTEQ